LQLILGQQLENYLRVMALNKKAELIGHAWEKATAELLVSRGYQILDRYWRIKEGELDIVALSLQ